LLGEEGVCPECIEAVALHVQQKYGRVSIYLQARGQIRFVVRRKQQSEPTTQFGKGKKRDSKPTTILRQGLLGNTLDM
jgi:hypothetical protein